MRELSQWEFDIYALSLPRGHGFGDKRPAAAWLTDDGRTCGIATTFGETGPFGYLVMRRRVDFGLIVTAEATDFGTVQEARLAIEPLMVEGAVPEPMKPGIAARKAAPV